MNLIKTVLVQSWHAPYFKATLIAVIASTLLLAGIATVSLSYAGQGTQGKVIRGSASSRLTVPCSTDLKPMENRTIDLDGDGVDDLNIRTCQIISQYYAGVILGTATGIQSLNTDLKTMSGFFTNYLTFSGTIGDSEPGTVTFISTGDIDRSQAPILSWTGNYVVLEGSGTRGLKGVCGGGTYEGGRAGPPPTPSITNYEYEFRFGEACNSANP